MLFTKIVINQASVAGQERHYVETNCSFVLCIPVFECRRHRYLTKTWRDLTGKDKRVRLITYARNVVRCASVQFSWNGPAGINWRRKKRMFAFSCGCFTFEAAKNKLGTTWEYKFRHGIAFQKLPSYDSPECEIADRFDEMTVEELLARRFPIKAIEY